MDVNWTVTILVGAALSFPVGILANLLTPRVQDWLVERSITSRGKTLERLTAEYERLCRLRDHPSRLWLRATQLVLLSLGSILTVILVATYILFAYTVLTNLVSSPFRELFTQVAPVLFYILVPILATLGCLAIITFLRDITQLLEFEEYEKRILARIAELEQDT